MRWKRVAWAGCLAPIIGGCHTLSPSTHDRVSERLTAHNEQVINREIRRSALEAWREVRSEFPRRMFTAEFRDGFLDGYADYLDRGGNGQPPAAPPPRYTRNAKYFTPEGHALIRDYFLGFKYGADVAIATGRRQYLTVPVLMPEKYVAVTPAAIPADGTPLPAAPLPSPMPLPRASAKAPQRTKLTVAKPASTPHSEPNLSKFMPVAESQVESHGEPEATSLPLPATPTVSSLPAMPLPDNTVTLPEPPADVPSLPSGVPTPLILDDIPPLPPNFTVPPSLPANSPDEVPK